MSNKVREFKEWFERERKRLQDEWMAAEDRTLARRTDDSQRQAEEAHGAYVKHVSLEDVEPPEGWVFFRPNVRPD